MTSDALTILKESAVKLNISMRDEDVDKFDIYMKYLIEYNEHTNLTAITEPNQIVVKHFIDSLILTKAVRIAGRFVDVGTGAGFPGVPVKIAYPEVDLTLVDSGNKKTKFLEELLKKLDIKADVLHGRAEELANQKKYRENFDLVSSRAVASLNILTEYCLPFVKRGGIFASMKGPEVEDEIKNAKGAIEALGGEIVKTEKFELPDGSGKRSVIVIKKVKPTSDQYPRATSKIIKRPL